MNSHRRNMMAHMSEDVIEEDAQPILEDRNREDDGKES